MYESSWFLKILSAAFLAKNKEKNTSLAMQLEELEKRGHIWNCVLLRYSFVYSSDNLQLILSYDCGAEIIMIINGNMIIYIYKKKRRKYTWIIELSPFKNENISFSAHTKMGWTCNEFQMNLTSCCIRLVCVHDDTARTIVC